VAAARAGGVLHPELAECAHRGQVGEAVRAETLHPAALMVHANQQVRPQLLYLGTQMGQLLPALPVAAEQDHSTGERMAQAPAVVGGEREARDVEDEGGVFVHSLVFFSTTTKLAA
jgi:hypothetical protein